MVVAVALGISALAHWSSGREETAPSAFGIALRVLTWMYCAAVVVALVGVVVSIVAIAKDLRAPRRPVVGSGSA